MIEMLNGGKSNAPYILINNIEEYKVYENINAQFSEKTRAYIKIQDGCGAACSYCIIPQVRGVEKSRAYADIYAEAKRFDGAGYHEIVLTGIEVSSYGRDLKNTENTKNIENIYLISLPELLEKLNGEPDLNNIKSIRLSSIDPFIIKKDFVDRLANLTKAANHLHLSLQSGSSRILNAMRRRYTAEQVLKNISYAKSKIKDLNLTADIIAGFPGETDEDFEKSLEMIKALKIYHAHIFTYSKRPGTDAADYEGQVPENIKNMRSKKLSEVCGIIKEEIHNENINREFDVIFEDLHSNYYDYYTAKTKNFMDVKIKAEKHDKSDKSGDKNLRGTMQRVKITSHDKDFLYGEILNKTF
jgi:threonylcarbamoyladenosine tRNA methylthiotransferase MtaB